MKRGKFIFILPIALLAIISFSAFKRDSHNFELSK